MAGKVGGAGHTDGALLEPHGVTAATGPSGKGPVTATTVSRVESVAKRVPPPPPGHAVSSTACERFRTERVWSRGLTKICSWSPWLSRGA